MCTITVQQPKQESRVFCDWQHWEARDNAFEGRCTFNKHSFLVLSDEGYAHNHLLEENLIDFLVPFLPLEYQHVKLCARDAFLAQGLQFTEAALDEVVRMMAFVPKEEQLFAAQGCKSVSQRINYFLPWCLDKRTTRQPNLHLPARAGTLLTLVTDKFLTLVTDKLEVAHEAEIFCRLQEILYRKNRWS